MAIDLSWRVTLSATSLHVAEAYCRADARLAPGLAAAVSEPAARLRRELLAAGFRERPFWRHIVPLAGEIENNRRLVETTVRKMGGNRLCAAGTLSALAGCVADLEMSVQRELPGLLEDVGARSEDLRGQWEIHGTNLLHFLGQLTDERLIVSSAMVDLLYPALGGAGVAHLPYNSVRLEAVAEAGSDSLPEVLRLAWLVSQLNIDLPVFSEGIHPDRHAVIAAAAMIPAVLSATGEVGLVHYEHDVLVCAVNSWLPAGNKALALPAILSAWWESYVETRPRWDVALAALDQMLEDKATPAPDLCATG